MKDTDARQGGGDVILLCAGGTGGHMFPAQALCGDLMARGFRVALATDARGRKYESRFEGAEVRVLSSGTLGGGFLAKMRGAFGLSAGIVQSFVLIKKLSPKVVVGFGGYPSFPPVLAAQKLGIPTVLHEQNAILGRANVMLAAQADRIALSCEGTEGIEETDLPRAVVTGNPVRADIAALSMKPYVAARESGPLHILVMGGSLGASVFSKVVPAALAALHPEYRARIRVVQQCREESLEATRRAYEDAGIEAEVETFFDDVAGLLERSHLVVSRSGASTVAEVTAAGRPAIFVPYPYHADQQQKINAGSVADRGGAWMIPEDGFTPEVLAARIERFMQNPQILFAAAEASRTCGRPDAARRLGNLVTALASGWDERSR